MLTLRHILMLFMLSSALSAPARAELPFYSLIKGMAEGGDTRFFVGELPNAKYNKDILQRVVGACVAANGALDPGASCNVRSPSLERDGHAFANGRLQRIRLGRRASPDNFENPEATGPAVLVAQSVIWSRLSEQGKQAAYDYYNRLGYAVAELPVLAGAGTRTWWNWLFGAQAGYDATVIAPRFMLRVMQEVQRNYPQAGIRIYCTGLRGCRETVRKDEM